MSSVYSVGSTTGTSSTNTSSQTTSTSSATATSKSKDVLRITGMASGLDVDSIVSKLMLSYQEKIDTVKQSQQKIYWKQEMYQNIISDVKDLQNKYFNVADPTNNVLSSSFYNTVAVNNTNTSAMTVTADTDAADGAYTVRVGSIAGSASISSTSLSSMVAVADSDIPGKWNNGSIQFSVTSGSTTTTGNLDCSSFTGSNISDLATYMNKQIASNSNLNGKVSVSTVSETVDGVTTNYLKFNNLVSSNSVQITSSTTTTGMLNTDNSLKISSVNNIDSDTTLSELGLSQDAAALVINYNGTQQSISVTKDETLGDLAAAISSKTGEDVYAQIDDVTGKLTIKTKATGTTSSLQIDAASSAGLLTALKLTPEATPEYGKDAEITIIPPQGNEETITEGSNNFTINGLTFNLMNTTSSDATVNVSQDVDDVFTKFKGFMDKYNTIITEINTKLTEKISFDYPPLTDSQKSSMSDSDITAWNTKAQQGLLHNDDNLSNFALELKDSFYQVVKGVNYTFGSKLGLDLSSDYSSDGTLVFSDSTGDTFKDVLKNNPKEITNFFSQTEPSNDSSTISSSLISSNKGIFQDLNDVLQKYVGMTGVTQANKGVLCQMAYYQDNYSNYSLGSMNTFMDQIYQDNIQINNLSTIYDDAKTRYYNQFSQLETAISSLNDQASVLSSYGLTSS